jgi:hypothetical protein
MPDFAKQIADLGLLVTRSAEWLASLCNLWAHTVAAIGAVSNELGFQRAVLMMANIGESMARQQVHRQGAEFAGIAGRKLSERRSSDSSGSWTSDSRHMFGRSASRVHR